MDNVEDPSTLNFPHILQSKDLLKYILDTAVFPREAESLKELRKVTESHPWGLMASQPEVGQLMALLLNLMNAKKTIEVGVFTGYSLLLTALNIPHDGKITAIDPDRKAYEIGLPIIRKAGVEHKIDFIESQAIPVLDKLLKDDVNLGSYDFAFVDADKENYVNYHEKLIKLVKVGGLIMYDDTLWGGCVAWAEEDVAEYSRPARKAVIELNNAVVKDPRVEIALASIGVGLTICRRIS